MFPRFESMLRDPEPKSRQTRVNWKRTTTLNSSKLPLNHHNCIFSRKSFLISLVQCAPGAAETRSERDQHGRADASLGGPEPTWPVSDPSPFHIKSQFTSIHHVIQNIQRPWCRNMPKYAEMNSASRACFFFVL